MADSDTTILPMTDNAPPTAETPLHKVDQLAHRIAWMIPMHGVSYVSGVQIYVHARVILDRQLLPLFAERDELLATIDRYKAERDDLSRRVHKLTTEAHYYTDAK